MNYSWIPIFVLFIFLSGCSTIDTTSDQTNTSARQYSFAFVGDVGLTQGESEIFLLINKFIGVNGSTIFLGDLGYDESETGPIRWNEFIQTLDSNKIEIIGNHDVRQWEGYSKLGQLPDNCQGDYGIMFSCEYPAVTLVGLGIGTLNSFNNTAYTDELYVSFLETQLNQSNKEWKICAWHKNRRSLQLGSKTDDVPLSFFETCRKYGAIVLMGHEHSYSRTKIITNYTSLEFTNGSKIFENRSVAIVSGLGGKSIREEKSQGEFDYWAAKYTKKQGAKDGVLFCNVSEDIFSCDFVNVLGEVIDSFEYSNIE